MIAGAKFARPFQTGTPDVQLPAGRALATIMLLPTSAARVCWPCFVAVWLAASAPGSAQQRSLSLDGSWHLSSDAGHVLTGSVPGDLISDLHRARIIQDPLYELGFISNNTHATPPWAAHVWTYSTHFTAPLSSLLVFDGIKMCAKILINGKEALTAMDQFLRYSLPVSGDVKLQVVFDPTKDTGGRYMPSSGGWDFMPYTNTREGGIIDGPKLNPSHYSVPRTFSRGIWKSVYVSTGLKVMHVVPQILHTGQYPTERLRDGAADFSVNVTLHVFSPSPTTVEATVSVSGSTSALQKAVPAGESALNLMLNVSGPALWWPQGQGPQTMHALEVTVTPSSDSGQPMAINATRMVGFRTLALVTGNDTDSAFLQKAATEEGSDEFTMFLRVNGEAVYARGANMVPMDQFEGRFSDANHRRLVQSSAAAGMNMIRVWGGGLFLPQAWYDACDEYGVLVYHVRTSLPHCSASVPLAGSCFASPLRALPHAL